MKHLKKMTKILLILTLGIIFSCESDDELPPKTPFDGYEAGIIGTWKLTSATSDGVDVVISNDCSSNLIITSYSIGGCFADEIADPRNEILLGDDEEYTRYTSVGSYFSISTGGNLYDYEIIELNSTTLILQYIIEDKDLDDDGVIDYKPTDIETYTRVL